MGRVAPLNHANRGTGIAVADIINLSGKAGIISVRNSPRAQIKQSRQRNTLDRQ